MQFIYRTDYPPMKTAVLTILAFASLFVFCLSCKKSNDNSTPPKSKTVLLTQSSWKVQSVGIDADNNGTVDQDVTSSLSACQLDNTYSFKSDSTGTMDEGATKCSSTDPQTTSFTWGFRNNETVLTGTFSFSQGDASILSMTDTDLKVAYMGNYANTTYHFIVALKH